MNILPQRIENTWLVRQDSDGHARADSKESGHSSGEDKGGAVDALVVDNDLRACAEPSCCAEPIRHGADQHVDGGGGDVVQLCETSASTADNAKRVGFIEDEAVFIPLLELELGNAVSKQYDEALT